MYARQNSLGEDLAPANDNINLIRRLREYLKRLAEENNFVPTETEEGTDQINQAMAARGGRQLVIKEYARPIIGTTVSCSWVKQPAIMCERMFTLPCYSPFTVFLIKTC